MHQTEVALNLWYVTDETHIVLSLKARAYVVNGTDNEKLQFLGSRALDYMIAEDFDLPKRYSLVNINGKRENMAYYPSLKQLGLELELFEECIQALETQFSKIAKLMVPKEPLVCITPLHFNDDFELKPFGNMKKSSLDDN